MLHADDVVALYFNAVENIEIINGKAFNIGGGINYSLSLLELFTLLEDILNIKMTYKQLPARESDQLVFVADGKKIKDLTGWYPKVTPIEGITKMIEWLN